jgi:hypothetical protein
MRNCKYIDSIAVPVSDKLMYDIAKAHGDERLLKLYKAFIKGEFGIVSHKRSFTDETFINILQETH